MTNPGEVDQEGESAHPGWQTLAGLFDTATTFFEKILFLRGYEFSSNMYVLTGDYLTVVDPGNDYTAFMELWKLGFQPADIRKIVLTHGHLDHAMGAFELLRAYPRVLESGGFELIHHEAGPREFKEMATQLGSRVSQVRGGETLELSGFEWEVIHTPGHTIDGICLYHAPTKTAFTDDIVLPHAMAEPDKNAGGRLDHYLFGVKALLKMDIENVLPGHGLPVAVAGRRVIEQTYESLLLKIIGVKDKTPWLAGAKALVEKGLLEEAVFCSDKEIACHPENFEARELKALCLNDLGRFQEALEVLDQMGELQAPENDDVFPLIGRGYALMGMGKYDEGIKLFDEALRIKPATRDALMYKGMALYLAGNYDEAMEIEQFRTEFVGRFKEELQKKKNAPAEQ
ncbi:MAG: MBL fold metallo-hydrolase [Acidobacteria bacterium]|nr:MBL fold metallo-hydrolase [Acidobacteriota bacterium]